VELHLVHQAAYRLYEQTGQYGEPTSGLEPLTSSLYE
jgi:hypothetical protein